VPEFTTSKITLICGLLLPIWDRLPADNMRIYRLQAEDGERAIGRLVSQEQMINVYARLGLNSDIQMAADEVLRDVMDIVSAGAALKLSDQGAWSPVRRSCSANGLPNGAR
jgi:hypothetical protein